MYGLVQAVIIAHDALKENLRPYGYVTKQITQGLWNQKERDINFNLVVNNFSIKYTKKQDSEHLIAALKTKYEVIQYWTGSLYRGIRLKQNY